jgi:hypothetical protein
MYSKLPFEVLQQIVDFLEVQDAMNLFSCSKELRHWGLRNESYWKRRCEQSLDNRGIPDILETVGGSYFNLYSVVLHAFGSLMGFYGGPLSIFSACFRENVGGNACQ